jgi:hypothetical protein
MERNVSNSKPASDLELIGPYVVLERERLRRESAVVQCLDDVVVLAGMLVRRAREAIDLMAERRPV